MAGWTLTSGSVNVLGAVSNAEVMPGLASWNLHTQLGGQSGAAALLYSPSVRASYAQILSTLGSVAPVAPQLGAGVPLNVFGGGSAGNVESGSGGAGSAGGSGSVGGAGSLGGSGSVGGAGSVGGSGSLGGSGNLGGSGGVSGSATAGGNLQVSGSFQAAGGSQSGGGSAGAEGSSGWPGSQPSSGGSEIDVISGHGGSDSGTDLNILPSGLIQELSSLNPIQQLVSLDLVAAQEVPEPDSDILLIAGLCAAGLMLRRRK